MVRRLGPTANGPADRPFRFGVDAGRGFIEDQDRRIEQQGAGDGEPLPFSAGQSGASFAQLRLVGKRHAHDELVGIGIPGGREDLFRRGLRIAIGDVLGHQAAEQKRFLGDHADLPAELPGLGLSHVAAVDADLPGVARVQASDEAHQRRLA